VAKVPQTHQLEEANVNWVTVF